MAYRTSSKNVDFEYWAYSTYTLNNIFVFCLSGSMVSKNLEKGGFLELAGGAILRHLMCIFISGALQEVLEQRRAHASNPFELFQA